MTKDNKKENFEETLLKVAGHLEIMYSDILSAISEPLSSWTIMGPDLLRQVSAAMELIHKTHPKIFENRLKGDTFYEKTMKDLNTIAEKHKRGEDYSADIPKPPERRWNKGERLPL